MQARQVVSSRLSSLVCPTSSLKKTTWGKSTLYNWLVSYLIVKSSCIYCHFLLLHKDLTMSDMRRLEIIVNAASPVARTLTMFFFFSFQVTFTPLSSPRIRPPSHVFYEIKHNIVSNFSPYALETFLSPDYQVLVLWLSRPYTLPENQLVKN